MNAITRYHPSYIEDSLQEPKRDTFSTTKQLLEIPWVDKWSKIENFSHFAKSDNALMAILKNGKEWWVIGFIAKPDLVNLPRWKYKSRNCH